MAEYSQLFEINCLVITCLSNCHIFFRLISWLFLIILDYDRKAHFQNLLFFCDKLKFHMSQLHLNILSLFPFFIRTKHFFNWIISLYGSLRLGFSSCISQCKCTKNWERIRHWENKKLLAIAYPNLEIVVKKVDQAPFGWKKRGWCSAIRNLIFIILFSYHQLITQFFYSLHKK